VNPPLQRLVEQEARLRSVVVGVHHERAHPLLADPLDRAQPRRQPRGRLPLPRRARRALERRERLHDLAQRAL
jgi:hypothetical protein